MRRVKTVLALAAFAACGFFICHATCIIVTAQFNSTQLFLVVVIHLLVCFGHETNGRCILEGQRALFRVFAAMMMVRGGRQ